MFEETKKALDLAFSAGVLASEVEDQAQEESVKYSSSLPASQMEEELSKARKQLSETSKLITNFNEIRYIDEKDPMYINCFFYYWFEDDLDFADKAVDLVNDLQYTMKRSLSLAVKKVSGPITSKSEEVKQEDNEEIENDQIIEVQDTVEMPTSIPSIEPSVHEQRDEKEDGNDPK